MTRFTAALPLLCLLAPSVTSAQTTVEAYLTSDQLKQDYEAVAAGAGSRALLDPEIVNLLPQNRAGSFVSFVIATRPALARRGIESLRLNKIIQSAVGAGGTSALSSAVGPAILGAAIEYGGVLQESTGTVTTLRANALGLARLVGGAEQFPYCPAIDPDQCETTTRYLRAVSGSASFEQTPTAKTIEGTPGAADLLGSDFRVASWGLRAELTPAGRLDDPAYVKAWTRSMSAVRARPEPALVTAAVSGLFADGNLEIYSDWRPPTIAALKNTKTPTEFAQVFNDRLNVLVDALMAADESFPNRVVAASRAFANYFLVRDEAIMRAQVHKASLEYTNHSPLNQPATSNLRVIYSHQPTRAPLVYTVNVAATAYNTAPAEGGRFRDAQLAAQLDRRLGDVPNLGPATLTLAAYYQWMKQDALIDFARTAAPSVPGLTLPKDAAKVLGTKGSIVVIQGKVAVALNDVAKVPFSITWSNRRELIPEQHTWRGQVGLSIDVDGLFK